MANEKFFDKLLIRDRVFVAFDPYHLSFVLASNYFDQEICFYFLLEEAKLSHILAIWCLQFLDTSELNIDIGNQWFSREKDRREKSFFIFITS
jgi:hypothetical protein